MENEIKAIPFEEVVKLIKLMNLRSMFYDDSRSYQEVDEKVKAKQVELGLKGIVHEREY